MLRVFMKLMAAGISRKFPILMKSTENLTSRFFSPDGHTGFAKGYKITKDSSWITNENMLCKIISLKTTTIPSRLFKLDQTEFNVIENKFSSLMADGN